MKTIIHVNRGFIGFNAKAGKPVLPTYIIREGSKKVTYGYAFKATGPLHGIDPRKQKQLHCGARAWLETDHPVEIIGAMTFQDANELREKHLKQQK